MNESSHSTCVSVPPTYNNKDMHVGLISDWWCYPVQSGRCRSPSDSRDRLQQPCERYQEKQLG